MAQLLKKENQMKNSKDVFFKLENNLQKKRRKLKYWLTPVLIFVIFLLLFILYSLKYQYTPFIYAIF